jgi:hypothetical protein
MSSVPLECIFRMDRTLLSVETVPSGLVAALGRNQIPTTYRVPGTRSTKISTARNQSVSSIHANHPITLVPVIVNGSMTLPSSPCRTNAGTQRLSLWQTVRRPYIRILSRQRPNARDDAVHDQDIWSQCVRTYLPHAVREDVCPGQRFNKSVFSFIHFSSPF